MSYGQLYEETGAPFTARKREKIISFLEEAGLDYDESAEFSVMICEEDGTVAASGALSGKVIKCVAVAPARQGENLTAKVISLITDEAVRRGRTHLFLYTKPENMAQFSGVSFYPIASTDDVVFMENRRNGIEDFLKEIERETEERMEEIGSGNIRKIGAVVCNCNPFTLGHRYLAEEAARRCDLLHVFVVSEDAGLFSSDERHAMVREGLRDMENVVVHRTGDYMVSKAVFPTYFLKDKSDADRIGCRLDLKIFGEHFVERLGINVRFVGTEPFSRVTSVYNEAMKEILPEYGVEVFELERIKDQGGMYISASQVRKLLEEGKKREAMALVPDVTKRVIEDRF